MKNILIISLVLFFSVASRAQEFKQAHINVVAKAEIDVEPDQIYLRIVLDEDQGNKKVSLEQKEFILRGILEKIQIPLSQLALQDAASQFDESFWRKDVVKNRKVFRLMVSDAKTLSALLVACRDNDLSQVYIDGVDHSRRQQITKDMRIKAMKAAKEKAAYLCEAVEQRVGKVLRIDEVPQLHGSMPGMMLRASNAHFQSEGALDQVGFRKITIAAEVSASFEVL